ncbi:MAG: hypothetical protein WC453_03835 [Patescibacteria group bacterium]
MQKTLILAAVMSIVLLSATACSLPFGQSNRPQAAGNVNRNLRRPDFGQPQRQADLRGVVTSVIGNEVNVLKIANNAGRRASSTPEDAGAAATSGAPNISLSGTGNNRAGSPGGFAAGGQRGGGPAGNPGFSGGQTDRAAMLEQLKAMSTGQETIIIPVGSKMMKFSVDAGTKQRTAIEANLTDISADKMITVWLDSSVTDKSVAEFVLIN